MKPTVRRYLQSIPVEGYRQLEINWPPQPEPDPSRRMVKMEIDKTLNDLVDMGWISTFNTAFMEHFGT